MEKFRFLLLDAGPIIKLFELEIWDKFLEKCEVTVARTVADEVIFSKVEDNKEYIDLFSYEGKGITIIDAGLTAVKDFYNKFNQLYKDNIHDGEKETLAYLCNESSEWKLCAADGAVFRVLGLLGKGSSGISLEEILEQIGMSK